MNYCKIIVTFFSNFSRGEIIAILTAFVIFIATIVFIIWWDIRKKRQNRIDAFIAPLLRFKTIIETNSIPSRDSYNEFINQFATHENTMSIIRNQMTLDTKSTFDKKWAKYKEEREKYRHYWDTDLKGKFSIHKRSDQLIILIDDIIKIANET